jgi:thioredoxin reductase (NADPH)
MLTAYDPRALEAYFAAGTMPLVVALCAAWCDSCNEFRTTFERIAQARPEMCFLWLDIEDDSEICGDIDIENFPTLAIYRGAGLLHYGVSLPLEGTVTRLIDEFAWRGETDAAAPQAVRDLPKRLVTWAATR